MFSSLPYQLLPGSLCPGNPEGHLVRFVDASKHCFDNSCKIIVSSGPKLKAR